MSRIEAAIKERLKKATFNAPEIYQGVVESVNENDLTCVVDFNGVQYYDVQLRAVVDDGDYAVVIPANGSGVVFGCIQYSNKYSVLQVSTPEKVLLKKGTVNFQMTEEGIGISSQGEELSQLIEALIEEIGKITVTTSSGPSGTPVNIAKFEEIKTRFKKVLKDVE